jgi:cobalt-zinc-cadmium efflux system membrane fusion protein
VHNCPWEHPDVAQATPTPTVTEADLARAERALKFTERPANGPTCKRQEQLIQFASQAAFDKLGIGVAPVWTTPVGAPLQEAITASGEVTYDPTRVARLSSRAAGIVWRVEKRIGDDVEEGEVLALIDSAEVGRARTAYVQSLVQLDLQTTTLARLQSAGEGIIEGKRLIAAEAALQEARVAWLAAQQALANLGLPLSAADLKESRPDRIAERVQFLGLPNAIAEKLRRDTESGSLIPITAPLAGRIVDRSVVARDVIDTTKLLFTIANIRAMWLTLDVRAEDAKLVRLGQRVSFRTSGKKDDALGKVCWISTEVDEKTRTVKVRADLENLPDQDYPDGRLRANTFGTGRIVLREEKDALVAPNEALHWEGCCWVAFVQDKDFAKQGSPKVFHVRKVRLGAKDQDNTEIIAGLLKGEMVATKNSGVLRSALLKNSLGAG